MTEDHFISSVPIEVFNIFKLGKEDDGSYDNFIGFQYIIKNAELTIYQFLSYRMRGDEKRYYKIIPIIQFSKIMKYNVTLIDTYSQIKEKDKEFFEIRTTKNKYFVNDREFFENLQAYIKDNKVKGNIIEITEYIKSSDILNQLLIKYQNWTTEYCYLYGEHLCPENNWILVKKKTSRKQGTIYEPIENLKEEFKDQTRIHEIKYEDISRIINIYNKLPINYEEGKVYKIALANAIMNWFWNWLKYNGINERKEIALIGLKGNRKSFIGFNTYGLFAIIEPYSKTAFNRHENLDADLKNQYPICLSRYFDEIGGFSNAMKNRKKSQVNGSRTFFTKNNTEMGKDYHFDNGFELITANFLESDGNDYDDKQFTYEPEKIDLATLNKDPKLISSIKLMFSNNITPYSIKLGKYIYDELLKINPEEFFNITNKYVKREDKQFFILELGEKILDKIGLLKEYDLDKDLFLSCTLSTNTNVETDIDKIKNCINAVISDIEDKYRITIQDFIKELMKELNNNIKELTLESKYNSFYKQLCTNGIMLRYMKKDCSFHIVLNSRILNVLRKQHLRLYHDRLKYNTLNNLKEIFNNICEKPKNTLNINNSFIFNFCQMSGFSVHLEEIYQNVEIYENNSTVAIPSSNYVKEKIMEDVL